MQTLHSLLLLKTVKTGLRPKDVAMRDHAAGVTVSCDGGI